STELPDYVEFFSPLRRVRVCYRGSFRNSFSASTPQLTLIEHRAHQEYLALRDLLTLVSRLLAEVAGPIPRRISLASNRCIPGLSGHCQALLRSATGGAPPGLWGKHSNQDRKSTRLNSSHQIISYAVFCLKKKNSTTAVSYHSTTSI